MNDKTSMSMGIPEVPGPRCRIDIGLERNAEILVSIPGESICGSAVEFDVDLFTLVKLFCDAWAEDEPEELAILADSLEAMAMFLRNNLKEKKGKR